MIINHQEFLVSLEQLQELELALASVKRDASSPQAFCIQAASIQLPKIRHRTVALLARDRCIAVRYPTTQGMVPPALTYPDEALVVMFTEQMVFVAGKERGQQALG